VLEVQDLTIRFGGLTAIDGLNLKVDEWEIVGLMGPNGAGKTTAFNCITGFYKPNNGSVFYRGREVTKLPPHRKAALGIGRTFQNVGMVKTETALQNLLTAQHTRAGYGALKGVTGAGTVRQREKELTSHAEAILDLLGLSDIRDKRIGALPYGTLKLLELGCALATDPDVLLLDEPSSGIAQRETEALGPLLLRIREETGCAMLVIEHDMPLITGLSDSIVALDLGKVLTQGPPSEVLSDERVVNAYLGNDPATINRSTAETSAPRKRASRAKVKAKADA
jgi:branched-chain amino acid transport system ATP-binding protein